ncbi:MAG: CHAT domain-containing protein, partial [Acidobacteriota bacterium]|nr:CHAT domain-containing protein [Acidobacteriota bacterium]
LAFSLRWPQHTARVWDALIRSRGLVLNELVARRRAAATDDPGVAALHSDLAAAAEGLAKLSIRGAGKASSDKYREELASAQSEVERLERALGEASAAFRDDRRRSQIGYDEVVHALPPGAALIGFTRRSVFSDPVGTGTPDTSDYMALVLAPGASAPTPMVLGPAPEIDALVLAWRKAAVGPGVKKAKYSEDEETYRRAGEALRRRIWDPLASLLKGAKTVFVVPDGELGLVNLAALPLGADRYLVEGGVLIHMLDEERGLVAPPGAGLDDRSVLLALGDPDFDWNGEAAGLARGSVASRMRGASGGCMSLDDVVFTRLPSTAVETATIAGFWRRNKRDAVRLTGREATEAEFKRRAPGKTVLHLATHGFVIGERCEAGSVAGRGIGGLAPSRPPPVPEEDSSLELLGLAGLALAGANHRGEAGPDEEDGVITAMEIAYLDLAGVDWAVLSACDSGVGESVSGEGVFGFRRAFRIAGARTVIMSLWPVEDASGLAWMEFLYRARLQEGMTTAESVQYASMELLRDRRDAGLSTHPFYWGAFIAAGDWR